MIDTISALGILLIVTVSDFADNHINRGFKRNLKQLDERLMELIHHLLISNSHGLHISC